MRIFREWTIDSLLLYVGLMAVLIVCAWWKMGLVSALLTWLILSVILIVSPFIVEGIDYFVKKLFTNPNGA